MEILLKQTFFDHALQTLIKQTFCFCFFFFDAIVLLMKQYISTLYSIKKNYKFLVSLRLGVVQQRPLEK
jgi:hypothetical protein